MTSYPPPISLQHFSQQYVHFASRAHQEQAATALLLAANTSTSYASAPQHQSQAYQPSTRSARSSHSPTYDDGQKPSLPSISNLFGMVDVERSGQKRAAKNAHANRHQLAQPHSYPATHSQPQPEQYQRQQHLEHPMRQQPQFHDPSPPPPQPVAVAHEAEPVYQLASGLQHDASGAQRAMIPPTPPMRKESIGENTQSPSTISTGSSLSDQPLLIDSNLHNVEADQERAMISRMHKRPSVLNQPQTSAFGTSPYATSPYSASPSARSASGSFYFTNQAGYAASSNPVYAPQQRPLPASFPSQPHSAAMLPTTIPLEHRHYIGPSAHPTYPQTQERYICRTCNKAFSRPSCLKIHSHSHTGEKPFRCPHAGCGKAFSVRSNVKRHGRGCRWALGD